MTEFPPPHELIPHAGNMVLLSAICEHRFDTTACIVDVSTQEMFRDSTGDVGAWVGIEYMAQCIAAHAGLSARAIGDQPRPGFLAGTRRLNLYVDRYRSDQSLLVSATQVWGQSTGMVAFDCRIRDLETETLLAEAQVICFLPDHSATEALA